MRKSNAAPSTDTRTPALQKMSSRELEPRVAFCCADGDIDESAGRAEQHRTPGTVIPEAVDPTRERAS